MRWSVDAKHILNCVWEREVKREGNFYFNFDLSTEANLTRPSRICARDQAANPKVSAGSSSAFMKHEDSGVGLIPISVQTCMIMGRSVFSRNQATKCKPASGTSRIT